MSKPFTSEELEAVYQIMRGYHDKLPKNEEEYYDNCYGEYEEPISKKVISSVLKKLAQQLPEESKEEIDKEFLRQKYHTFNNQINERVYSTLKRALNQLKTVEITYFDMNSAEFKKRKINVYYASSKYTIGYCHLRKEMRKFRTSRMGSAKLTDQDYRIPKNFNKNDY